MNARTTSSADSPIATPDDIRRAAQPKWRIYMQHWAVGDEATLFPIRLRVRVKLNSTDDVSLEQMAAAVHRLRKQAKETVGSGYTVHYTRRRSRDWGEQDFPDHVTIDTPHDLVALVDKREAFQRAKRVSRRVREVFPELETWIADNAPRLGQYADVVDSLVAVCRAIRERPRPDCYVRELNVPVDTKFIEQNATTLRHWLDRLLPPSAIRVDERSFARRYGLRDGLPHHLLRVLDESLLAELSLPFDELSLPMRHLANLAVADCTVIIVENRTNLLTLPRRRRTLAMGGIGDAATRLRDVIWLKACDLVYWGDIDVDGFRILRNLRKLFPNLKSVMMDAQTLADHSDHVGEGNGKADATSPLLTAPELEALATCSERNVRLEQEKIPRQYAFDAIARICPPRTDRHINES